jgi:hypothetical protein
MPKKVSVNGFVICGILHLRSFSRFREQSRCVRVRLLEKHSNTIDRHLFDTFSRRARRLDVQFDVGDLCSAARSVRSREAVPSAHFLAGTAGAMVGLCSSLIP